MKWISVKDSLPLPGESVLIYWENHDIWIVASLNMDNKFEELDYCCSGAHNIEIYDQPTHWARVEKPSKSVSNIV